MANMDIQWENGRVTISLGRNVLIKGARAGVCVQQEWRFPFENEPVCSTWRTWKDSIGAGKHQRLIASEQCSGLATHLNVVVYENQPLCRIWMTVDNRSAKEISLQGIHLLEVSTIAGGSLQLDSSLDETVIFTDSGSDHWSGVSQLLGELPDYAEKWTSLCPPKSLSRMRDLTGRRRIGAGDHNSSSGLVVLANVTGRGSRALLLGYAPVQCALSAIICRAESRCRAGSRFKMTCAPTARTQRSRPFRPVSFPCRSTSRIGMLASLYRSNVFPETSPDNDTSLTIRSPSD